jgi:hypothetical protein
MGAETYLEIEVKTASGGGSRKERNRERMGRLWHKEFLAWCMIEQAGSTNIADVNDATASLLRSRMVAPSRRQAEIKE